MKNLALTLLLCSLPTTFGDEVRWNTNVESSLQQANQSGQLVLMKFTADWCVYCKKMERDTFAKPAVAGFVNQNFVPALVDADKHQQLVKHLKIKGLPAILIVSPDMVILERISGYQTEAKLLPTLKRAIATHGSKVSASQPQLRTVSQPALDPTMTRPTAPTKPAPKPAVTKPAFGGLCLPSVTEQRSLVSGTPQHSLAYQGKFLYFRDAAQKQKFLSNPTRFWPARNGNCPVSETGGQKIEGRLEYAAMYNKQLWFTASPEKMKAFIANPSAYVAALNGKPIR